SEEFIAYSIAILLCSALIGYILYIFIVLISDSMRNVMDRMIISFTHHLNPSMKEKVEKYISGRFSYYEKLSERERIRFVFRVRRFVRCKHFSGKEMEVTPEMKVLIASSAIQLTFGLENYFLDYFDRIIIFPDSYYSPITGLRHMGEANVKGL